jgi:hypothetical protein
VICTTAIAELCGVKVEKEKKKERWALLLGLRSCSSNLFSFLSALFLKKKKWVPFNSDF